MEDTVESVKAHGVLVPAIARPREEGGYELVAGHRRHRASLLAGLEEMPVIVRELDDDEATIIMVDSNLQRETLLPSERAFAYRMKLEAMKHQGERRDLTSCQVGTKLNQPRSNSEVAENSPDSARNIARFIRLTALIPPLLDMVDNRKIAFNPAVELSYLSEQQQYDLCEAMEQYDCTPSLSQAQRLKEAARAGKLDKNGMELVMQEEKPNQKEVVKLSRERLNKYFPPDMPPQKIEETIVKALDLYYKRLERHRQEQEYMR